MIVPHLRRGRQPLLWCLVRYLLSHLCILLLVMSDHRIQIHRMASRDTIRAARVESPIFKSVKRALHVPNSLPCYPRHETTDIPSYSPVRNKKDLLRKSKLKHAPLAARGSVHRRVLEQIPVEGGLLDHACVQCVARRPLLRIGRIAVNDACE